MTLELCLGMVFAGLISSAKLERLSFCGFETRYVIGVSCDVLQPLSTPFLEHSHTCCSASD